MNVLETEWWTMAVPPEWWADSEEDSILVGDQDDVGCIEISTLHKEEGEFDAGTVRDIAEAESEQALQWQAVSLGDFTGLGSRYVEEGTAVREWYVANGALLLFITYSCDQENQGMDDAAVDELLDTLMLLESRA
ncbi:MAG: hypothetical protein KDI17_17720 [Halioglobus sp.]|jgi:hypothetical protein|nr:hypothetical protein [Halioglobus sp.]